MALAPVRPPRQKQRDKLSLLFSYETAAYTFQLPMRATRCAHLSIYYLISLTIQVISTNDAYRRTFAVDRQIRKWMEVVHVHTKCVPYCPVSLTGLCVYLQVCFMSSMGLCIMRPFLKQINFSLRM
jgi:hypothetical protein